MQFVGNKKNYLLRGSEQVKFSANATSEMNMKLYYCNYLHDYINGGVCCLCDDVSNCLIWVILTTTPWHTLA